MFFVDLRSSTSHDGDAFYPLPNTCPSSKGCPVPEPETPRVEENIVLNYWTDEGLEFSVLDESSGFPKRRTWPLPMGGEDEMMLVMEESHTEVVSTSHVDDGSDAHALGFGMNGPFLVFCTILEGRHLKDTAVKDHKAPFTACCGIYNDKDSDSLYFKTDFVSGAPNHFWNQTFVFQVDRENPVMEIFVLGRETTSVSLLGYAVHTFTSEQIESILRCRVGGSTQPFFEDCWVNLEGGEGIGVIHLRVSTSPSMDRDRTQVLASSAIDMYDYVITGDLSSWLGFKGYLDRIEERQIDRWLNLQKDYPILFTEPHSFQYYSDNIDLLSFVLWGIPSADAGLRVKPKLLERDPANGFELHSSVSYARYLEGIEVYQIKVEYGTARWSIWKEYADFLALSESLGLGEILGIIEKKFDVKERRSLVAMANSADILEKRRRALDEFLKQALRVSESGTGENKYSQDITNFFGMRGYRQVDLDSLSNPRGSLWYALSGAYELASDSTIRYEQIVGVKCLEDWINLGGTEEGYELAEKAKRDIALDIRRTDSSLNDTEAGQLFEILGAFALMHPKIGYCQAMNFITLCLLRVCRSEKHAFFVLCSIVRNILPYYYINSMKGVRADMLCVYNLFKKYLPSILRHFEELGLPLELFLTEWLLCILSNDFPKRSVFLLWDWFFLEGPEVVFYILLAFFTKIEKDVLRCTEMEECIILIKLEAAAMYDAIELVDLALKAKSQIGVLELRNLREMSLDAINMSRVEQQKKKRRPSRLTKLFKIISPSSSQIHDLQEAILRIYQKDQEMQQAKASKQQYTSANLFVDNFQNFFNPHQKAPQGSSISGVSSDSIPLAVPEFFGLSRRSTLSMASASTAQSFKVITAEGEARCYIECCVFEKAFMRVFRRSHNSSEMSIESIESIDFKGTCNNSDDDGASPPGSPTQTPYASDEDSKVNGRKRSGVIRSALKRVLEVFTVDKQDMIDFQELLCVLVMLSSNVTAESKLKLYFEILRDQAKKEIITKANVLFLLGIAADVTRREMFKNALDSLIINTDWISSETFTYEEFLALVDSDPRVKKALNNNAQQPAES